MSNRSINIKLFEPVIEQEEIDSVIRVLKSGWLAQGPEVEMFEKEFAEYIGVRYSAAVSNGTVALMLALKALGIGQGDEVLVPDYTFIATATAPLMVGAIPKFVDVDVNTFNIDIEDLKNKISDRTKAVIVVHLFGHPANIKAVKEVIGDKNIMLIEDAAQAHGAEAWGQKVGSFGDAAIFSFYATKNITTGEGGMVVSDKKEVIEKVKLLRNHGQISRYIHAELGGNYRMTSIQAAIGRAQLRKLDRLNEIRRDNAQLLSAIITSINAQYGNVIELPVEEPWARHVYHLYAIKLKDKTLRDYLYECMNSNGVEVAINYPLPLHSQPLFKSLGYKDCCPTSSNLALRELSLPVHPKLSRNDINTISMVLSKCIDNYIHFTSIT
ncbi:Glutamine--scyllo-inositol transaminase [Ignisphaera aggregans DSM 17230]|uniref:Glutamine--scyllo-inositol transaminase n=1 Tax=Ignisphaera aggregans (strain DSM 17230 / JCM 13409 / AQ1.S1) TaxID=583356 RepID=E0SP76_IGNAA|nr:Glutamine--scyllo-inositol transaminase [Ignisphaera aggregans DSM 17230]